MNVHVLPGDAVLEQFNLANIDGDVIVFREALVTGPLDGADIDAFWDVRANFMTIEYGEDPIDFREKVVYEIERLEDLTPDTEIHLWFEYELFCQANMWFCLDRLSQHQNVFRVAPLNPSPDEVWKGFGPHSAEDLAECLDRRVRFSSEDLRIGSELWGAFRSRDSGKLIELGKYSSPAFPFLKEVCDAAAVVDTEPLAILREIRESGHSEIDTIFPEFQKRAGVLGFGDLQVEGLLHRLENL
ncbi:MAG TPA: DUF1835 domain-containing protein [Pyrinomonadaceae bacterium]|nr:DUF1835 domain-containing protein [Pyrinomonadaceae bacterium]